MNRQTADVKIQLEHLGSMMHTQEKATQDQTGAITAMNCVLQQLFPSDLEREVNSIQLNNVVLPYGKQPNNIQAKMQSTMERCGHVTKKSFSFTGSGKRGGKGRFFIYKAGLLEIRFQSLIALLASPCQQQHVVGILPRCRTIYHTKCTSRSAPCHQI